MAQQKKISVVIISFNTCDMLKRCLKTLFEYQCKHSLEIFCVDNASKDGSADMVANDFPQVHLIRNGINGGFAPSCNQVVDLISGDYLLILNSDAEVVEGALDSMVGFLEENIDVGIAGAQLLEKDGSKSVSIRNFPSVFDKFFSFIKLKGHSLSLEQDVSKAIDADWVTGAFLFVRGSMISETGLFDDRFFFYFDEADICKRAWKNGWKVKFVPWIEIPHLDGGSGESHGDNYNKKTRLIEHFFSRSEKLYFRKHNGILGVLTLVFLDITIYSLRFIKNLFSFSSEKQERLSEIRSQFRILFKSLRDTKFGSYSPPAPW